MVHDLNMLRKQIATQDSILPFQIEPYYLRGRFVRLSHVSKAILRRHQYPDCVAKLITEMLILAPCLSSSLKYDGVFTLQVSGQDPIKTLLVDVTSNGALRAYAAYDAKKINDNSTDEPLQKLTGGGYIAFTVDQGKNEDRYQGIVELNKNSLADCVHDYFRNSEQIETIVNLSVEKSFSGAWHGAAIIIQKEAFPGGKQLPIGATQEDYEEAWRNAAIMLASCTKTELLDTAEKPNELLYKLFHETGVRIYPKKFLKDECRCSIEKIENMLLSLNADERQDLKVDGKITVTCEFCKVEHTYDEHRLEKLLLTRNDH